MRKKINKKLSAIYKYQTGKGKKSFSYGWEDVYRLLREHRCKVALENAKTKNSVLEVGPADSGMSLVLAKNFKKLTILEPTDEFANQVQSKLKRYKNAKVYKSLIEDFKTNERFDYITLSHVLEHIDDDVKALRKLKSFLKKNGKMFILVPNANCINRQIGVKLGFLKKKTDLNKRDIDIGHQRVYDFASLEKACKKAGLKILKKGGLFLKPFTNVLMQKNCSKEMLKIFMQLGEGYPDIATEIYLVCGA